MHYPMQQQPKLVLRFLLTLVAVGITGCGAAMSQPQARDPVQVHEQWIVALRDGNRPSALAAFAPGDLHDAAVDNEMQRIDSKLHSPSSTLGQLVQVTPDAPRVDGAQARGLSHWQFGNGTTLCYETKLNQDGAGAWFVTQYGTVPCP